MNAFDGVLICPYCGSLAKIAQRKVVSGRPLDTLPVYVCGNYPACDAYVGCHLGTEKPLGSLANKRLRSFRMKAHRAFDFVWKTGRATRDEAYALMAELLNLPPEKAHIGMLDVQQCKLVMATFNEARPWKMPKR